jgi:manganese/zinc/iron transport system substrate-binding protein
MIFKSIKNILSLSTVIALVGVSLLLSFGCSQEKGSLDSWMENNGKIKVLSTTNMIHDLVSEIGKEWIDATPLIIGEIDPHSYELVKGDDEKLSRAQMVFFNGLGLEHGASLHYRLKHHPRAVGLGDQIAKKHPEAILRVDGQVDPHIWMDVSLWAEAIDPIVEAFAEGDPEHASDYRKNGEALRQKMRDVHQSLRAQLQEVPASKRFLVTSHDAFNYFARSYLAEERETSWKERVAAPEGLAPDGQLSSADIQKIIKHLMSHQIGVVFPESNVSRDSLRKIVSACQEKGLLVKVSDHVLYGDAMGPVGSDADTYLKMMKHNGAVLRGDWQ